MSNSGALFDLNKLNDISKNVLVKIPVEEIYDSLLKWAKDYKTEIVNLLVDQKDNVIKLLSVGRNSDKPRKDLVYCEQIFEFISYFFDDYFKVLDTYPENIDESEAKKILKAYLETYDHSDDQTQWFGKITEIATANGYAAKPKDYKKNPEMYKGHFGDVSTVIRIDIVGLSTSPDIWELQQIMGDENVKKRVQKLI
jgi:glutamyl-tRNA synthetase